MTVVVGGRAPGQVASVVTANEDADEPRRVDFSLPGDGSPLCPGLPGWANYVKGVIQHYRGKQMSSDCIHCSESITWDLPQLSILISTRKLLLAGVYLLQ